MKSGRFIISALSLTLALGTPLHTLADPVAKADSPTEVAPITVIAAEEVPCDPKRPVALRHRKPKPRKHRRVAAHHRAKPRVHHAPRRRPVVAAHVRHPKPLHAATVKPASQRCYVYRRDRLTRASLPLEPERLVRAAEPALYNRAPIFNVAQAPLRAGTLPIAEIPSGGGSGAQTSPLTPVGPVGPGGGGGTPASPGGGGGTPTPPGGGGTTPPPPGGGGGGPPPVTVAAAPEPGSWALMITGVGLAGLALRRRRQGPLSDARPSA